MVDILQTEFKLDIPILMDDFDNPFQKLYKSWPDRAFVLKNKIIKYISQINDDGTRNNWINEICMLDI